MLACEQCGYTEKGSKPRFCPRCGKIMFPVIDLEVEEEVVEEEPDGWNR